MCTGGPHRRESLQPGPVGPAAEGSLYVGVGADGSRVVRSTAPSAPCGEPMDSSRGRPTSRPLSASSWRCGARASASSRSPTTTSIRCRSTDLAQARRRADPARLRELEAIRAERFALMERLERLPEDMVFYTQITMEAAEDPEFMAAMKRAPHQGCTRRRGVGHRRGAEGRLQGVQPPRRGARRAAPGVPDAWHPRAGLVHLRPAERSSGERLRRPRSSPTAPA